MTASKKSRKFIVRVSDYVTHAPAELPKGKILVHNQVKTTAGKPGQSLGGRGSRAWLATKGPEYVKCDCGFAAHIPAHYRVKTEKERSK